MNDDLYGAIGDKCFILMIKSTCDALDPFLGRQIYDLGGRTYCRGRLLISVQKMTIGEIYIYGNAQLSCIVRVLNHS
jgi:hypothetical protein